MGEAINGNLSVRAVADTTLMEWVSSPSGSVWRKRVHLVGPPESGQVTSVVRYDPASRFPAHNHPEGEEILVLEGVFSDEHGDWPAGTFLLNPEGFRHAPFSESGCVLLVKLRQFPGRERRHVVVDTHKLAWGPSSIPAVAYKPLYQQAGFSDLMRLERWEPRADLGVISYEQGAELFVLEGEFADEVRAYSAGCWLRLPVGSKHHPRSAGGCTLYVKRSGRHCQLAEPHAVCQSYGMDTAPVTTTYKNHRFPVEIISHAVWLYFRFCLSFRDVEELLLERGVVVTYEAIRQWCRKFGQAYATQLRRRRPRPGDKWHLDEVFLTLKGEHHYLWRAVDQDGNILDILVQRRRNKQAAKKFFRKLLKGLTYVPRVIITDKLKSYGAAKRELLPGVEHRQHRYLNNRAENSHQPTRQRERRLQRFKSPGHAQRFLSAYGPIAQHFRPRRHRFSAPVYRQELRTRFQVWQEITTPALAA